MDEFEWQKNFSERLHRALFQRDMSQSDIADRAKITRQTMSKYINGDRIPKANIIVRLAKALNVDVNWLINFETKEAIPMDPVNAYTE